MNEIERAIAYLEACMDGLDPEFDKSVELVSAALRAQLAAEQEEYQALGPVDHLRELAEAGTPTAVIVSTEVDREYIDYICPRCGDIIDQKRKGQNQGLYQPKYHADCGQRLDWSRAEAEAALGGGRDGSNIIE